MKMKHLFKVLIVIFYCVLLTACSTGIDENESESNGQNEITEEQTENNEEAKEEQIETEPDIDTDEEPEPEQETEPDEPETPEEDQETVDEVVIENDAIKVFEPAPDAEVSDQVVVRGLARVFEGTVEYEFEDGHFILDEGFTTASGGPEWGEFEIIIDIDDLTEGDCKVVLFETSAEDGSRIHQLVIPVYVNK